MRTLLVLGHFLLVASYICHPALGTDCSLLVRVGDVERNFTVNMELEVEEMMKAAGEFTERYGIKEGGGCLGKDCVGMRLVEGLRGSMCARLHKVRGQQKSSSPSIQVDELGRVMTTLQVLSLDPITRRLPIPEGSRVWVEVGANSRNLLAWAEARCEGNEDVYVISFEPLLAQYAAITHAAKHDELTALGETRGARNGMGVSLPLAVASGVDYLYFNVSPLDSCSGTLDPLQDAHSKNSCTEVVEKRRVPALSLEAFFDTLLPEGARIDFLKIDTQGSGLDVIASAGRHVDRIDSVLIDTQIDTVDPLYQGQNSCSATVAAMRELNFFAPTSLDHVCTEKPVLTNKRGTDGTSTEANIFFSRDPTRKRPSCEQWFIDNGMEWEDIHVAGLPGQLPRCRPDKGEECPACRHNWYGNGFCYMWWSEEACSCSGIAALHAGGRSKQVEIWGNLERAFGDDAIEQRDKRLAACDADERDLAAVAECKAHA
ncbi:hypothetical protein TrST_g12295 [Triparma strigata]|uniref:Methyltransferase FkbM domain-containing protein n=1 Tax=Triparma strigata TaxID=1606541 RepID=A0A9W7B4Z2_9STRA|nr:hypothetical protein TrST_g12295 [Triparma strigata]